jgi:hypothetical protein
MNGPRVVVLSYVVRGPLGGMAWHHLQYVLGLARLGCDVFFAEDSDDYPSCYDPDRGYVDRDPAYGLRFAAEAFGRLGLGQRWAYHDAHTARWLGPGTGGALGAFASADLLLNVSGVNPLRPWARPVPARALIDTDPVFTQVRHLTDSPARALAGGHTAFFTFGENIPTGRSRIPADGFPWQATRQPIVLDVWPVTTGPESAPFTTVMQWDSYPARTYQGQRFGMKADSFAPYLDLPSQARGPFELALGSASAPRDLLRERGWAVRDPLAVTCDPWAYQRYLAGSKAEFGVAKHGYVEGRCGWFSERSAAYLASGRPVVVQETGFSDWLAAGEGVLAFGSPEEAAAAVAEVGRRYELHCRQARAIAEEFFDARRVLARLVEQALVSAC